MGFFNLVALRGRQQPRDNMMNCSYWDKEKKGRRLRSLVEN